MSNICGYKCEKARRRGITSSLRFPLHLRLFFSATSLTVVWDFFLFAGLCSDIGLVVILEAFLIYWTLQ